MAVQLQKPGAEPSGGPYPLTQGPGWVSQCLLLQLWAAILAPGLSAQAAALPMDCLADVA